MLYRYHFLSDSLIWLATIWAFIGNDIVISVIGITSGVAIGIIGIFQRIDETSRTKLKERLHDEEKEHNETRRELSKYKDLYGPLKEGA